MQGSRLWSHPPVGKQKEGNRMKGSGLHVQIEMGVGKGDGRRERNRGDIKQVGM